MAQYEITFVDQSYREWQAKQGPAAGQTFHSYSVTAKGPDGQTTDYEVTRKPTSGPPPLGPVEAEVVPSKGDFPDKLKLTPQGRPGGFSRSPRESARIERQHSQEMALRFVDICVREKLFSEGSPGHVAELVKHWTDHFMADLDVAGGGGAPQAGSAQSPAGATTSPAAVAPSAENGSVGFASPKQADYFESLLKKTPATPETRGTIVLWAVTRPTRELSSYIDLLKDDSTRLDTAKDLAEYAKEWAKTVSDVPADTRDLEPRAVVGDAEDIPF